MTDVFVERHWDEPRTEADLQAMVEDTSGCLETHRCEWRSSLLSADARELFCHFTGPDAESVRLALRDARAASGWVWAGTIHDAPGFVEEDLDRANVLVARRFERPADFDALQALEDAGSGCLELHRVRFVRTLFSRDQKRMICLYEAPDAESVRLAQREARMPVEKVWAFRRYTP